MFCVIWRQAAQEFLDSAPRPARVPGSRRRTAGAQRATNEPSSCLHDRFGMLMLCEPIGLARAGWHGPGRFRPKGSRRVAAAAGSYARFRAGAPTRWLPAPDTAGSLVMRGTRRDRLSPAPFGLIWRRRRPRRRPRPQTELATESDIGARSATHHRFHIASTVSDPLISR
jgi:hypothetical protein